MKKILVLLFAVMATLTVNAQLYVGGTAGFANEKMGDAKSVTTFKIMPEIGYNLSENWAIGATLGYAKAAEDFSEGLSKTFQIAPYVRYTFVKSDLLNLFVDGSVAYMSSKADVEGAKSVNGFEIGIKPGIAVNLSDNFSLIAKYAVLNYQKVEDYKSFGLDIDGNALSFGLLYKF